MEICPVCNKKFKSQFALNGHLRLKRDAEHKNFYQPKTKKINNTNSMSFNNTSSKGFKTMDILEKFFQQYEKNHEEEIKEDRFIEKLRNMIQEERKIDLDKERERMRKEVMQEYQTDIANAVEQEKQKLNEKNKEEIETIRIKIINEYKDEYHKKYAIYLHCIYCHGNVLLSPGSELHSILDALAIYKKLVYHPECFKLNYHM